MEASHTKVRYEGLDLAVLASMPNYYAWILEIFAPYLRGRVVEYGAGTGTVSQRLLPHASELVLVEPSGNLVELLEARFAGDPSVEIVAESLEAHSARMAPASVDSVILVNVLEHIEDDKAALGCIMRMLRPGGHLLIFVPAMKVLMSDLDRLLGHYRRYEKSDLTSKVVKAGGEILICKNFDFLGILPWLVLNSLLGVTRFSRRLVRVNDALVVPIGRWIEGRFEPPLGKNLILVARKPG
jgi:SAM-dependent methyltransferase